MAGWADDPELVATFRAEVDERLAALQAGLLALETHPAPRQVVAGLFRDAHTVKGSARMLGLDVVLQVAHHAEDLLGAIRDGRVAVRRDVIDLLLAACDGIGRSMPGHASPVAEPDLAALVAALTAACGGEEPVAVPSFVEPERAPVEVGEPVRPNAPDSVRVAAAKVYELLDVVGEAELGARRVEQSTAALLSLAAEQARWSTSLRAAVDPAGLPDDAQLALHRLTSTTDGLAAHGQLLRELVEAHGARVASVRDQAMGLAMVPVRRVFAALPRLVREVAVATGKQVRLELSGEDVELDKQILDGVTDALKHLVTNAVDHGCETPAERRAAGKPEQASVRVAARGVGATVAISVSDDGRGVDESAVRAAAVAAGVLAADTTATGAALLPLLFTPALSTAAVVTETSGRGVGLDVVRAAVEELAGSVEVESVPGAGTTFTLTLPVTLGVLRCLIARVGGERYAIPVAGVVESIGLRDAQVHEIAGAPVVVRHGVSIPLLDLGEAVGAAGDRQPRAALVVRGGGDQLAWAVDRLEGELELVVKDLGAFLGRPPLVAGATIDADGSVVCLLDLRELGARAAGTPTVAVRAPQAPPPAEPAVAGRRAPRVLVVEDSVGVRELQRVILEGAGYQVETAVDGLDGVARLGRSTEPADLVLSDVEMPGMDGFALTRTIRRTKGWEQVPVVIMTSRGDDADRRAGLDAGASAYLLKSEFDQVQLVDTVRRLVGR